MQVLNKNELINIIGGSYLMITPYYGFVKVIKYIAKIINTKF